MNTATITIQSPFTGESVRVIEDANIGTLYARIVGTVDGALSAGCTITNMSIVEA